MKLTIALLWSILCICALRETSSAEPTTKPNIVFIFADDWGWGDLSCHGSTWLKTPNLDRLASEGTDFQQFNVLNPVCSPSRVAAMTGRYPSRFGVNNVFGGSSPEMPDWLDGKAPTTARYLKAAGYRTAHFGKWHMGDMPDSPPMSAYGFDESAVYHGPGPKIKPHDIADRAAAFIEANKNHPFFLDVWIHESHTAHDPTPASLAKWQNLDDEQKRIYAAVITDGDNNVGKVLDALEKAGVAQNTLVVFSSDNGPESTGGEADKGTAGKLGSYYSIGETGGLRGRKRSIFEGGVRVPFIARWPDRGKAGNRSAQTICLTDLMATCADILGAKLPENAGEDSVSILPALLGTDKSPLHEAVVHHSINGSFAIRQGKWNLELCGDSGGWSDPKPGTPEAKGLPNTQLYDLQEEIAETKNVRAQHPEEVARLTKLLEQIIANGRSTPGAKQANDAEIQIRKKAKNSAIE